MNSNEWRDDAPADVGEQRIARVYAEALLNAADKSGQADAVVESLESLVGDVFKAEPDFETFLASAAVGREQKAGVIEKTIGPQAGETFTHFLLVLNNHDRLALLRPILAAARQIRNRRANRVRVLVRSAVPLAEDQGERLKQELRETLHLEPLLDTRVDPELLGGLVVQVGDWLYDGSVRTRIQNLRNQLIERGSHEIQSGRDRFGADLGNWAVQGQA